MSQGSLLFFAGLSAIILISRLAYWSGVYASSSPGVWFNRFLYRALTVAVLLFLGGLSWDILSFALWGADHMYWHWVSYGRGSSLLGGIAAGLVALGLLEILARAKESREKVFVRLITSAPAIAIGALYLLSVPEAQQLLGLSGVKGLGIELAFTRQTTSVAGSKTEVLPPGQNILTHDPAGQFLQLIDMTLPPDVPKKEFFADRPFFDREAGYLRDLHEIKIEKNTSDASQKLQPIEVAIERQRDLLRGLSRVVQCGQAFRTMFPSPAALESRIAPALELLTQIDWELVTLSDIIAKRNITKKAGASATALHRLQDKLNAAVKAVRQEFEDSLPDVADQLLKDLELTKAYKECHNRDSDILVSLDLPANSSDLMADQSFAWTPPYISIFIAHSLATLGHYEAGLKILNSWMRNHPYTSEPINGDPARGHVTWFHDNVAFHFTTIQGEALASIVYDGPSRDNLRETLSQLQQHLRIELSREGIACNGVPALATIPTAAAKAAKAADEATEIHSRLAVVVINVAFRYAYAVADTRAGKSEGALGPEHERLARELIELGRKCLPSENTLNRLARQSMTLSGGGRLLARWALDGERAGFLTATDRKKTQKVALNAMLAALPLFSQIQRLPLDNGSPIYTLTISQPVWETISRIVTQEITGLAETLRE